MSSTNGNGRRWTPWLLIAVLVGSMPGVAFGIWWQHYTIAQLQDRFIASTQRYDRHILDFNGEVARERDEDTSLERQIADTRRDIAALQASVPARLPAIAEIIGQAKLLDAQNGRMDEIDRRLRAIAQAQNEQHIATCQAIAKLSAASARGAGC